MIRFGWNKKTLTARFVRVLCVTFLPLGILTFVAACLVVWFSSNQISASYEHSLEGDMIPLQENILETEEELDDFVLDHLAELTMERGHDEVLNYEMIDRSGQPYQHGAAVCVLLSDQADSGREGYQAHEGCGYRFLRKEGRRCG